jgi:hydrogenase-4 component F
MALQGQGSGLLKLDGVGLFYLGIADLIFALVALYSRSYFSAEDPHVGLFYPAFFALLFATHGAYLSHNLGLLWVFVEGATLAAALLVYHHRNRNALEATWKYLMLGSVGVALGLIGVILVYAALGGSTLEWGQAKAMISSVNPEPLKLAFAFLLIGFGSKVGLFPLHTWLPDAHSEAPSPGSALLSGTLLNIGFYALLRYTSLMEGAGLVVFAHGLLMVFGLLSLLAAALFMMVQRDFKRMLAYSSIEHMGLAVYALGLGVPWLALLHTLFHSIAKTAAFLLAGNLVLAYGSKMIAAIGGVARTWPATGWGFLLSVLALAGLPPFPLFYAEFQALKLSAPLPMLVYLLGLILAFVGVLGPLSRMGFGETLEAKAIPRPTVLVFVPWLLLLVALVLGLFPPVLWVQGIVGVLR